MNKGLMLAITGGLILGVMIGRADLLAPIRQPSRPVIGSLHHNDDTDVVAFLLRSLCGKFTPWLSPRQGLEGSLGVQ